MKYKAPTILFQAGTIKTQSLATAFESVAEFQMDVTDAAGFHSVKEVS